MKNGRLAQLQEQIVSLTNTAHGFMDLYYSERDAKQHVEARADAAEAKLQRVRRLPRYHIPIEGIQAGTPLTDPKGDWISHYELQTALDAPKAATALDDELTRLREAHQRNVDSRHHNFKHQPEDHRCGWRVMYEAVVERSKAALSKPGSDDE